MRKDDAYLLDILIAAQKALKFVEGVTWEEFNESDLLQNAVMRPLEIIGEAASRISEEIQEAHPEIPWGLMIGLRNRLVHEYFHIQVATVWDTIQRDLKELIRLVEPLVPPEN
jgi:uncharacterized protein with HEPN domain